MKTEKPEIEHCIIKETEKPEIKLYMYSSVQEFPVGKGHSTFLNRISDSDVIAPIRGGGVDWNGKWGEWRNWFDVCGPFGPVLDKVVIRSEDFGGIIYDTINDRIYKVNVPGYKLFQEILEAHKKKELAEFHSKQFEHKDVELFISFLKGAGLWSM
jgi:hypothetical protein